MVFLKRIYFFRSRFSHSCLILGTQTTVIQTVVGRFARTIDFFVEVLIDAELGVRVVMSGGASVRWEAHFDDS